jgi:NAD(P)-dependent dehydrogenase (short-subunit alcohol dehydrogenase family)
VANEERASIEREGAVALVTGSARGLGLSVARMLRARGDRVHVVWRSSAAQVPTLEREFEGRVHRADLSDPSAARTLVERVLAQDARLDWLVHAVGEYTSGSLEAAQSSELQRMFASNVETAFTLMHAARAALRATRGAALFFGTAGLEGLRARRDTALYAASKSALAVLVRSWALEEAAHGVRVNLISPGLIPHAAAAADTHDAERLARVPLGRGGTPAEVALAAAFLCSDRAAYTTGTDFLVAGGWLL